MKDYTKLTIFFDGKCIVCFEEIKHYKKLDKLQLIKTIDISASDFDAADFGLDETQVNINMHAINENGEVFVGVDTFAEIWKRISLYNNLSFILENRKFRPLFDIGYKTFANYIRPNLPKRKCHNNYCEKMA